MSRNLTVMAIDPGCTESAYVIWDGETVIDKAKEPNDGFLRSIRGKLFYAVDFVAIEQVRSYGMAVGADVFDTVFWSGRFAEAFQIYPTTFEQIPRRTVKMHLCHNNAAKDANIIQALRDRFAYGQPNYGKGTKKEPGFFYGFKADIWQSFALAVTYWDQLEENE